MNIKLNTEYVIKELLRKEYLKTFKFIDNLNQQEDGLSFDEWLVKNKYANEIIITQYVLGIVILIDKNISTKRGNIIVIKKVKPEFIKGKITFPGGKVMNNEYPLDAIKREFKEETSIEIPNKNWTFLTQDMGDDWCLNVFYSFLYKDDINEFNLFYSAKTMEEEEIFILNTSDILTDESGIYAHNTGYYLNLAIDSFNNKL